MLQFISVSPKNLMCSLAGLLEDDWIMGLIADLLLGDESWSEEVVSGARTKRVYLPPQLLFQSLCFLSAMP